MAKKNERYLVSRCNYERGWACSNWTPDVVICKTTFTTLKDAKNFVAEQLKEHVTEWRERGMKPRVSKWEQIHGEELKLQKTLWNADFDAEDDDWDNENTDELFYQIAQIEI
jgi:hypothetical protein